MGTGAEGLENDGEIGEEKRRASAFVWREVDPSWEMNPLRVLRHLISGTIARWQCFFKMYLRRQFIFRATSRNKAGDAIGLAAAVAWYVGMVYILQHKAEVNHHQGCTHTVRVRGGKTLLGLLINLGILITCALCLWPMRPLRVFLLI